MPTLYSEDSVLDMPEHEPTPLPPEATDDLADILEPATTDSVTQSVTDQEWTARLVGLLSHLDYHRRRLERYRITEDMSVIVQRGEAMVQITEEVARKVTFSAAQSEKVSAAIAKAGTFFTVASSLRRQPGKGLLTNVLNALAPVENPSPEFIRDFLLTGCETLNCYFSLFTDRYSNKKVARLWVDAASAFIADYKQTVRQLQD